MIFNYRAFAREGGVSEGQIEAESRSAAVEALAKNGLKAVSISEAKASLKTGSAKKSKNGGGEKTALALFKKLLQLCGNGSMPVSDALKSLSARSLDPKIKSLSKTLYKDLSEGRLLASALEQFPNTFDKCICRLVEAGEATANLPFVFKNVIKYLEDRRALRKTIVSALAYPVFLCLMATAVVLLFMFFMLPKIKSMMANMGAEENFPIMLMDFIGKTLAGAAPAAAVIAVVAAVAVKLYRRSKNGRLETDRLVLKIPVLARLALDAETARFASLCSALLASGVNSSDVFGMAEKSIKNEALRARFRLFRTAVNDGAPVPAALQKYRILPDEDIDIISVGEKTGSLVQGFGEIAQTRAENLERGIKFYTGMLGAIALGGAFILVFIFATGIILSILGLSQSIAG